MLSALCNAVKSQCCQPSLLCHWKLEGKEYICLLGCECEQLMLPL